MYNLRFQMDNLGSQDGYFGMPSASFSIPHDNVGSQVHDIWDPKCVILVSEGLIWDLCLMWGEKYMWDPRCRMWGLKCRMWDPRHIIWDTG